MKLWRHLQPQNQITYSRTEKMIFFLEDKQANIYLSFVYKALFSTNRASLDMHTAV